MIQALQPPASLAGRRLRMLDGNQLPAGAERLAALRDQRGAAPAGHMLVVCYDPNTPLVTDIAACGDAHAGERSVAAPLLGCAEAGERRIADREFCMRSPL